MLYTKWCTIFVFVLLVSGINHAQNNLFIPKNIGKAFTNYTRSMDGNPGLHYWQNSSHYKIKADIDPFNRILKGSENVLYKNNSPDTLKNFVIRLYQNINKTDAVRDFGIRSNTSNDGMIILDLVIDGEQYDLSERKAVSVSGTNMNITLKNPIHPDSKTQIEINWQFELPEGQSIRFGAYDSTSYFIAYWYPQVAVYDDIDGWDRNEYTGITEFYNDFSDFDVELTLPDNFAVWSTGILGNPEEIFSDKILSRYRQAFISDEVIGIITKEDLTERNIFNKTRVKNTWFFKAESIPDFAFGFSDHYLWDASSIIVDSVSGRRVYLAAAYKESSKDFYSLCDISRKVISHFSYDVPGIPYPFPGMTVFNGAGGMEFPMIVNNGSSSSYERAASLAAHEIAHSYFPFYMGINERKYAWLDEGHAVFLTNDFQDKNLIGFSERSGVVKSYERAAGNETELPLIIPSYQMKGNTYRIAAYNKPAIAYEILRQFLGKDLYSKTLKEFIYRWNGKHPIPHDFFNTFNNVTGQELTWFWKPWFFEYGFPDLAIASYSVTGDEIYVVVKKVGDLPVPVVLNCYNTFGEKFSYREEASIWQKEEKEIHLKLMISGKLNLIEIGDDTVPDINRTDDVLVINNQ